ncbi:MAG TPA: fumarylacetoacetate hydrolase family protein [Hypericibacter adhaerens]|uniref:2-keto-4-pentenoate hydratase n=1 Tax=Hypericibacter adhaerens TaxID=2602016 RepID=UPI002CBE5C79|nr:fumarylacetoacetate hydrolase family protein [Hypericibacter adhaerens]HWA45452.1 fumarylacetoacetate hydrolase family protein [Hypericibacter adhaerens]
MSETAIETSVQEIVEACDRQRLIQAMSTGVPKDLAAAYAIQDRLFQRRSDGKAAGWFASATNRSMLHQLGLTEPYGARWRGGRFLRSPATIRSPGELPVALEAEISFQMARDLPPRGRRYEEAEVVSAVRSVHPSVEIVISCFRDWMNQAPLNLIAEGGIDQFLVHGAGLEDWRRLDLASLPIAVTVNGQLKAAGRGANVLDGPVSAITWLANHAAGRGEGLKAGQICNTGMCAPVYFAKPGDEALVDFGPLGRVEVSVV